MKIIIAVTFCLSFIFSVCAESLISPKSSIEFSENEMVIDGGSKIKFICPHDTFGKDNFYKTLKFKDKSLYLRCHNDYLGGIYLIEGGAGKNFLIGQSDGDAGDSWNIQTLIFLNEMNELILWKVYYSIYDKSADCDAMTEDEKKRACIKPGFDCTKIENYYSWSDKNQTLTEISYKSKAPNRKLEAPENYKKHCSKP